MKLPYEDIFIGEVSEYITNPFSGEGIMLSPEEVAVLDTLRGCEIFGDYEGLRKGINWFIENNAEAYMVLLD